MSGATQAISARVLTLLLGTLFSAWAHAQGVGKPPTPAAKPAAALPASQPLSNTASAASPLDQREIRAQLQPSRQTTLAAEIGAKINRLPVPEGGAFREGQALVHFDCMLMRAQLNKAKAMLMASERNWQANKRLAELHSIGKVELDTSEAEVMKARAEVQSNTTVVSKCTIAAPFSGRVAEQKVREQQYVQTGQALLEILDDSSLELEFIVPSKWQAWLKIGLPFQVHIDETGKSYPAKVQRIGARVDALSQSVKIFAAINGKFSELSAGMSGRVEMSPP